MANQTDREKLSAWLHEWQLDRAMTGASNTPSAGERDTTVLPAATPEAIESEQVCFQSGDVLLLKPQTPLTRSRPVYVVTLGDRNPDGQRQVIPFARFSAPATPGEVFSGLEPLPLWVLCEWNRRMVPETWLQASTWPVCRLTTAQVSAMLVGGEKRQGPRLVHPLDPRHAYLDAERALWEELVPALVRWQYANGVSSRKQVTDTDWEHARAAEDRENAYGGGMDT